jgi:hypothetical protein
MLLSLALLMSAVAAGTEPVREPWATVTKKPALVREETTLAVGTLGVTRNGPFQLAYYAKRILKVRDEAPQVHWVDSKSCPALIAALAGLRGLAPPRIDVPGFPRVKGGADENVILDGISYTLELNRLRFSTNIGSALADWTDTTLRALEPCWRKDAPVDVDPEDAG